VNYRIHSGTEGIKDQLCWGACTWRYRKTAHIKLNTGELMAGCSERERETFQEGIKQKSAFIRVEGEPHEIA
jgi:hypothetical protein